MYYQNYEDYMRSILGYPMTNQGTYQMNYYDTNEENTEINQDTKELEDLYPDLYKTINPSVLDVCTRCKNPITRESLEDMVEEVYSKIENNEINLNINIVNDSTIISRENENRSTGQNSQNTTRTTYSRGPGINTANTDTNQNKNTEIRETRQRRPNNPLLRDLIRILILNRLINNRPNPPRPPRPPFPGMEPGRPPMPPPRPEFDNYYRF